MIKPAGYAKEHRCDAPADCYTTGEVVKRLGVSARQLQWWDEHKHVSPLHHAHVRYWTKMNYAEVAILLELRERGMTLATIRRLRKRCHAEYQALVAIIAAGSVADQIVVASATSFSAWTLPASAVRAIVAQRTAVVFMISAQIFSDDYRRPTKERGQYGTNKA